MKKKEQSGQVNSDIYEDTTFTEYVETGKLDFDFLLGRHLMHVNNLLSQDILGETIQGNSLGVQRCEVALDILSNMIEIYTKTKTVSNIASIVLSTNQIKNSKIDIKKATYYQVYKEIRTGQFKRYDLNTKNTKDKKIKLIEFRYNQLSIIHRYLMLWIDECGLTPSTNSMNDIMR